MGELRSMEQIIMELCQNLMSALLVYFPRKLLVHIEKEERDVLERYSNRLFLIEKDGWNYFVETEEVGRHIISKPMLLEDNMFKLLQLQEQFNEGSLKYLLKKYGQQLEAYIMLSRWYVENAKSDLPNITLDQFLSLNIQRDSFDAHQKEFISHFGDYKLGEHEIREFRQEAIDKLKQKLVANAEQSAVVPLSSKKEVARTKKQDKKKRIQEIRERAWESSEKLILAQVFNVKFKG